jgi:DHHC palmitoyltransferase
MDHHCPWLGNCVGHNNYKYFVLMLLWTIVFCPFVALTLQAHPDFRDPGRSGVMSLGFALGLGVSTLFFFHLYLVFKNRTTMECGMRLAECAHQGEHKYDLGTIGNLNAVLGENKLLWLIPTTPEWSDPRVLNIAWVPGMEDDKVDAYAHPAVERLLERPLEEA